MLDPFQKEKLRREVLLLCVTHSYSSPFPLRIVFVVWTVTLWKILTLDNLRKRNFIVVD
jgi:hypothetical protein